ncbi:MAG TPA: glycosyltransferase [Pyrinomonadaceae bacterium]|nr:glycosyltransferase [Pyrinomonadaceae bacterium]
MATNTSPVLIGPLPAKGLVSGLALCFQIIVEGWRREHGEPTVINLTGQATVNQVSAGRIQEYASILRQVRSECRRPRTVVYLTMAQSMRGFLRDAAIIHLARRRGHDLVLHLNGGNYGQFYASSPPWLRFLIRWHLRRVRTLIVVSERLRNMFAFDAKVAERVVVVPNALPDEPVENLPVKQINRSVTLRLLYLSNLIESKGYLETLEVVRILRQEHGLPVKATFCGKFLANPSDDVRVRSSAHGEQLFHEFIDQHGLRDCVEFAGQVAGEKKRKALLEHDFLLLPTRYDNEAQPLALIEALAYGLVPITTDYRANPDVVVDGVTGHLVDWRDSSRMAAIIAEYCKNPGAFSAVSAQGMRRFREQFSRDAHLARMFRLLEPAM